MARFRKYFGIIIPILVLVMYTGNTSLVSSYGDPIQILLIVDDDYGANVPPIIKRFEDFGWNVTIAGLKETVISCSFFGFIPLNTDILIPNVEDVTFYDCVSVLPGKSHLGLLGNQTALDLIKTAAEANVVVSGWCKAVRVLAWADVLDGRNVTGDTGFISEYEDAGATYMGSVLPVIDGNIVTSVRGHLWQGQMCAAIGKAIGVFEDDIPVLGEITVEFHPTHPDIVTISVEITDDSRMGYVGVRIFKLNKTSGERLSDYPAYREDLLQQEAGIYRCEFFIELGLYVVDFHGYDIYYNEITIDNLTQIDVVGEIPEETSGFILTTYLVVALIPVIVKVRRKKLM